MASISNSARRASKMPQLDNDDQYLPSDAVLMERIRPNHKSHSDFSQIFGSGLKLNEATAASSKSNITPASAANTSTSTAPRVGSLPRLNIINSNSFSDPVAPPRIRHSVTTMESSSPIRRQQLTQQQDVPSVSRKLSHHSALSSSRPSDAIGTFKLEPFSLEQEAATANRSPPVTTSSPLRKPSIRSSPSSASSPLRNELKKAYTSSPIREVQFEEEGEELYEDTVAADATLTQLPQLDSFNHITETQKLLLDCSVFSTSVEKKFKEGVKFAGIVHDVKDGFNSRFKDITTLVKASSSSNSSSSNSSELDANSAILAKQLYELHAITWRLYSKLGKLLGFGGKKPLLAGTKLAMKKDKLMMIAKEVHETWTRLMLQITLMISKVSSKDAQRATTHVRQLAVATGAPDWEEISLKDATMLYLQGDKYLLGYGLPKSYDLAYKRYYTAAEAGLPEAANMLGTIFENGLGKKKDMVAAIKWYKVSASNGCSDAMNNLGRIYQCGLGVKVDYHIARQCYADGAAEGNLDCMVNMGNMLETGLGCDEDPEGAFNWYAEAANMDYAKAQNAIGSCYYKGFGHDQNFELAIKWFRLSAEQGYTPALNNLGICYEEGLGVSKDNGVAKQLYREAALLMHPSATNNYGYMLLLEKHYDDAIRHFHLAMSLGCSEGSYNLATLYEGGVGGYTENELGMLNQDHQMAIKYYKWAADQNHVKAQLRLGALYLSGPEYLQNHARALFYLSLAAESNDADAQNLVGQMKELGLGGREDNLEKVILGGLSPSNVLKSHMSSGDHYDGVILKVEPDYHSARHFYKRAMQQGHAEATFNMGSLFENGFGVERDLERATALYVEAARRGCSDAGDRLLELGQLGFVDPSLLNQL